MKSINVRYELRLIKGDTSKVLASSPDVAHIAKLAGCIAAYNADTTKSSQFYAKVEDMPADWNMTNFFKQCGWLDETHRTNVVSLQKAGRALRGK